MFYQGLRMLSDEDRKRLSDDNEFLRARSGRDCVMGDVVVNGEEVSRWR